MQLIVGLLIFIVTFYLIVTEKVPGSLATMCGGLLMALIGIINEEEALHAIGSRLEILFLLIGMMIIVNLISETGVFQWLAIKIAQLVKGNPFPLIIMLSLITALCSAFLDNVTTILLMAPVSILLANQLEIKPFIFLMSEIMAANIGGSASLIGDPTQLIIGNEGNLGFNNFLMNTAPVSIIALFSLLLTIYILYRKDLSVSRDLKAKIMSLDSSRALKDVNLLKQSLFIFSLVIIGFVMNNFIDKGLAVISLSGASILLLISKRHPEEAFKHVEWDTLFFFIGLFMLIEGVEKIHLIDIIGKKMVNFTMGHDKIAVLLVLWVSSMFTSIIGNVASAATFSKIVHFMLPHFRNIQQEVFWWALSLGTCLGGNLTVLASATNVVAISSGNKAGIKITFVEFLKFGSLIAIQGLIISSIYLMIRYF